MKFIKPKALNKGDVIIPILPAGFLENKKNFYIGKKYLEDRGYFLKKYFFKKPTWYFSGDKESRKKELEKAFYNNKSKAIIGIRGGYGCSEIIDFFDKEKYIKSGVKIFCGFSDLTTIHLKLLKEGFVSFYGPMISSDFSNPESDFSFNFFKKIVSEKKGFGKYKFTGNWEKINSGKTNGVLTGGCLSLIQTSLATDYEIETDGKILFFEDVAESPYKIDRMLTHLKQANKLQNLKGVIVGDFSGDDSKNPDWKEVIFKNLKTLNVPSVMGIEFGHIKNKITLPLGVNIILNSDEGYIDFIEGAVI